MSQLDFSRYQLGEHVVAPYRLRKTVPSKHLITNQSGLAVWFAFGSKEQVWFGSVICRWKQGTGMVWRSDLPLKQRTGKCLYEN